VKNVLPKFPLARAHFEKHFCDSYALLRTGWSKSPENLPPGFALTVLGIKSIETIQTRHLDRWPPFSEMLHSAGLDCLVRSGTQIDIFNPELLKTALPPLANSIAVPKRNGPQLAANIKAFDLLCRQWPEVYSYDALALSSLLPPDIKPAEITYLTLNACGGSITCPSAKSEVFKTGMSILAAVKAAEMMVSEADD
jgi:hypothetical protein